MSLNLPPTVWAPPTQGEFSASGNPNLATEAGLDLLTEARANLVLEDETFTPFTATVWAEDDSQ